jgi:putative transcriptional regulator
MSNAPTSRLVEVRLSQGMTQADLARRLGVNRSTVCRMERNALRPSLRTALTLARVLNTTVEHLFPKPSAAAEIPAVDAAAAPFLLSDQGPDRAEGARRHICTCACGAELGVGDE